MSQRRRIAPETQRLVRPGLEVCITTTHELMRVTTSDCYIKESLAETYPHPMHELPDIKRNRKPVVDIGFDRPGEGEGGVGVEAGDSGVGGHRAECVGVASAASGGVWERVSSRE